MIKSSTKSAGFLNLFWHYLEFYSLSPRLNRTKFYALHGFWLGFFLILISLMDETSPLKIPAVIIALFMLPNMLALQIRRIHDIGISAWWLLLTLIPYLGFLMSIIVWFYPGTKESNKFGERPSTTPKIYWFFFLFLIFAIFMSGIPTYMKMEREHQAQVEMGIEF